MSVGQGLVPEHAGAQSPQTRQTQKQGPHRIAVLPGDGIGKEVMPEALWCLRQSPRNLGSICPLITLISQVATTT